MAPSPAPQVGFLDLTGLQSGGAGTSKEIQIPQQLSHPCEQPGAPGTEVKWLIVLQNCFHEFSVIFP